MHSTPSPTAPGGAGRPRRAAIYFRSATKVDKHRVDAEIAACRATGAAAGLDVTGVYCDNGFSGLDEARPEWTRLERALAAGEVHAIITRDPARIGRGNAAVDTLRRLASAGVEVLFADPERAGGTIPGLDEHGEGLAARITTRAVELERQVEQARALRRPPRRHEV